MREDKGEGGECPCMRVPCYYDIRERQYLLCLLGLVMLIDASRFDRVYLAQFNRFDVSLHVSTFFTTDN